jgi:hypothetical protein
MARDVLNRANSLFPAGCRSVQKSITSVFKIGCCDEFKISFTRFNGVIGSGL